MSARTTRRVALAATLTCPECGATLRPVRADDAEGVALTAQCLACGWRCVPSGLMVCPGCGRHQTRGADGHPTPHTTEMGGSQLCAGRAPTGAPS